jgi:hypothetical protein
MSHPEVRSHLAACRAAADLAEEHFAIFRSQLANRGDRADLAFVGDSRQVR